MPKIGLSFVMVCALVATPLFFSCNNSTNPQPVAYDSLTVVKPTAGDVIMAGAAVIVQWGYSQNWAYNQVRIQASISNKRIPVWKDITQPINCPQNTFQWTVPSDTSGDSCRIKIFDYDQNKIAYSGYFKITK
jgi:hypothetical protein